MAAEVLRRAVEDVVGSVLEGTEAERRRHGRVDNDRRGVGGGRLEIGHRQERVRRRLEPDELRTARRRPRLVELDVPQIPARKRLEQATRAEVRAFGERDRLARSQRRERERRRRAGSGGEEHGGAAVELAEPRLCLRHGRVPVARVEEVARLAPLVVGPEDHRVSLHRLRAQLAERPHPRQRGEDLRPDGGDADHHRAAGDDRRDCADE